MSPCPRSALTTKWSFPRVSGDEPQGEIVEGLEMAFSPRERG